MNETGAGPAPHARGRWLSPWLLVLAVAAPFVPAGPLAIVLSAYLVTASCARVVARVVESDGLALVAFTLLLSFLQIAATAELLSLFNLLNDTRAWLGIQAALWLASHLLPPVPLQLLDPRLWLRCGRRLSLLARAALLVFLILAATNLLIAFLAGITEYDSITTYVPYVFDYCQQGNLHYPPHALPGQAHGWSAPVSFLTNWHKIYAYTIVVSNSIVFLNVLGWLATAGAFVAALAICRTLRISRGLSLLATVAVFSAPQFIAQSANTMYDQIQAFTMACVVLAFLKSLRRPTVGWVSLFALAHVAIMAMKLSWAFVFIILGVLDLVLFVTLLVRRRPAALLAGAACGFVGLCVLVLPHFLRNLDTYGSWMPRGRSLTSVVSTSSNRAQNALLLRSLKCLLPYELHYVQPDPPGFIPGGRRFARTLWSHISDCYTEAASYFGVLPLIMLLLLIVVTLTPYAWAHPRRRWLLIMWAGFAAWCAFQLAYARLFHYTPWNSRYMLIAWVLAAPTLAAGLLCLHRVPRRWLLSVIILFAAAESVDFFLQRQHMPINDVMNLPRLDHFIRDPRYPRSNIAQARAFLDARRAYEVYTDVPGFFRLLYYDAFRRRRIIYTPELPLDGTCAAITNISPAVLERPEFDLNYECFEVVGDMYRRGRRVALVPRGRPASAPPTFLQLDPHAGDDLRCLGVAVGDSVGGALDLTEDGALAWIGSGPRGSLRFDLEATSARPVWLVCDVRQMGIALPDPNACTMEVWNGFERIEDFVVNGTGKYAAKVSLHAGHNIVRLVLPQLPGPERYSGDSRPTMLLIDQLKVLPFDPPLPADVARTRFVKEAPHALVAADASVAGALHILDLDLGSTAGQPEWFAGTQNAWLGARDAGRLDLRVTLSKPQSMWLALRVLRLGISLPDETRCPLEFLRDDQLLQSLTIETPGDYWFQVDLPAGPSVLTFRVPSDPDDDRYGADPRPAMLYVTGLRFRAAIDTQAPDVQSIATQPAVYFRPAAELAGGPVPAGRAADLVKVTSALADAVEVREASLGRQMGRLDLLDDAPVAWIGPRAPGRFTVRVEVAQSTATHVIFDIAQLGAALRDPSCCPIQICLDDQPQAYAELHEPGLYAADVVLPAGPHTLTLGTPENPGTGRYGLDARPTMLLLRSLTIAASQEPPPADARTIDELAPDPAALLNIAEPLRSLVRLVDVETAPELGGIEQFAKARSTWLGPLDEGELSFGLVAPQAVPVVLKFRVLKLGVALPDEQQCPLEVLVDNQSVATFTIDAPGEYRASVTVPAGHSTVTLRIPEEADNDRYGLDQRPTMLYINKLRISADGDAPPTAHDLPARSASE